MEEMRKCILLPRPAMLALTLALLLVRVCRKDDEYLPSIAPTDPDDDEDDDSMPRVGVSRQITAGADVMKDFQGTGDVC